MMVVDSLDLDSYQIWWHPAISVEKLWPEITLDEICQQLNTVLEHYGTSMSSWTSCDQNRACKLVRANWLYHTLPATGMRKPIACVPHFDDFKVICGDTRLMAIHALGITTVKALCVSSIDCSLEQYGWAKIWDNYHLLQVCGMDSMLGHVKFGLDSNEIKWFDIGDTTTSFHLHDPVERQNIMQSFLLAQTDDFRFDKGWIRQRLPELDKYYN